MNDIAKIAVGSGLQDGLNPCIFMACAIVILILQSTVVRIVFGLVYLLGLLFFNFGFGQVLILQKQFILVAKIIYFVLGAGSFALGVLFLKDWFQRPVLTQGLGIKKINIPGGRMGVIAGLMAVVLSSLSTLWPINKYVFLLGNEGIIKGQWYIVCPLLFSYVLSSMWAFWLCWGVLSFKNLRPSLIKIFCAAVFLVASSCMILVFK